MNRPEKDITKKVRAEGLALIIFLVILLAAVAPSPSYHVQSKKDNCATLELDTTGNIQLISCRTESTNDQSAELEEISQFLFAPMNINTASFAKLMTVRGVGKKLAAKICDLRQKKVLTSVGDLALIEGVGKKRARRLGKYFLFGKARVNEQTLLKR